MAKQTINNGEIGLSVRNKLNGNFTELYDGFGFDTPINWLPNQPGNDGEAARGFIDTAPANHPDEAWASLNVEVIAPGSDKNGPLSADYAGVFSVTKQGYASGTVASGEIDALTIFVRQDGPDGLPSLDPDSSDAAGILVNAQNVGTCGILLAYEGISTNLNRGTGLIDFALRTQIGVLDMNGAGSTKFGFGAVADAGVITAAFLANTNGGSFTNILQSPGVVITATGNYAALSPSWPNGAWLIQRDTPANANTEFTHRGTGTLRFQAVDSGNILFQTAGGTFMQSAFLAINTFSPSPAAALDVTSTTGGVLFPRMTTAQRDAISSPPNGLQIYNTTTDKMQVRAAGSWVDLH